MTITPADAATILAKCAYYDPMFSKPDKALAHGWSELFARRGLELGDLLEAVTMHYDESADRAMPVHLIRHARQLRSDRIDRDPQLREQKQAEIDARIEQAQLAAAAADDAIDAETVTDPGAESARERLMRDIRDGKFGRRP